MTNDDYMRNIKVYAPAKLNLYLNVLGKRPDGFHNIETIFASFIFYGMGAFGVFVLRRKMKENPRPYKAFGYPVLPAIFVIFCAVLVVVTIIQSPRDAGIGLGLVLIGIPFYIFWNRKKLSNAKSRSIGEK